MLRLLTILPLLCARAEADCPSGSSNNTSVDFYEDCKSGNRISAMETICNNQDGNCVASYLTIESKVIDCHCACYPNAEIEGEAYLHMLCGDPVDCGDDGTCDSTQLCCNGHCIPYDATCCSDGSSCPGTCTGDGKCCPANLPVYDGASGYCCGQTDPNNTSTVCLCATECTSIQGCCPGGTVCCDGGWCAAASTGCPMCPAALPVFCPDGTCAPAGAVCCGNGLYCPNGLSCADSGGGVILCGSGSSAPTPQTTTMPSMPPQPPGAPSPTRVAQKPTITATPGKSPVSRVKPISLPGCNCQLGGSAPLPWPWLLVAAALILRRRRVR